MNNDAGGGEGDLVGTPKNKINSETAYTPKVSTESESEAEVTESEAGEAEVTATEGTSEPRSAEAHASVVTDRAEGTGDGRSEAATVGAGEVVGEVGNAEPKTEEKGAGDAEGEDEVDSVMAAGDAAPVSHVKEAGDDVSAKAGTKEADTDTQTAKQ